MTVRFVLIAGPCAIESLDHAVNMTGLIKEICKKFKIQFFINLLLIKLIEAALKVKEV